MLSANSYIFKIRNKNQQNIIDFLLFIVSKKDSRMRSSAAVFLVSLSFLNKIIYCFYLTVNIKTQLGLLSPTQLFTFLKSTVETPEQYVKLFKVKNKGTTTMSVMSLW